MAASTISSGRMKRSERRMRLVLSREEETSYTVLPQTCETSCREPTDQEPLASTIFDRFYAIDRDRDLSGHFAARLGIAPSEEFGCSICRADVDCKERWPEEVT